MQSQKNPPEKNISIGIIWALLVLLSVFFLTAFCIGFIIPALLIKKLVQNLLSTNQRKRLRNLSNKVLKHWHTFWWYWIYYQVMDGLYHILDIEHCDPWMGIDLRDYNDFDSMFTSLKNSTRRRMTTTLNKKFDSEATTFSYHFNRAPERLIFSPKHILLMFESCRRRSEDLPLAIASYLKLFFTTVMLPFSIKEYYQNGNLVAYIIYGVKGDTLHLVECAISSKVSKQMVYHHMIREGIIEGFDRKLSYVCAGFGGEDRKRMAGLEILTEKTCKGFTFERYYSLN